MRNINFDPNNIKSLPDPGYETRDNLSVLAAVIVAARCDLSTCSAEEAIRAYDSVIRELHTAYDSMETLETLN